MHRCLRFLPALAAALLTGAVWLPTQAQTAAAAAAAGKRNFPPAALRGELVIVSLPEVTLNGKAMRTTPGFRLFDPAGRLIMAHTLAGQRLQVNYLIEPSTQWLHQAWLLTPEEAALKR